LAATAAGQGDARGRTAGIFRGPAPAQLLRKESTLADAILALNQGPVGGLLILDEKGHLWGTIDANDLYHVIARIAVSSMATHGEGPSQHKLSDFLLGGRVYVALDDPILVASATMLDHGISWMPVVQSKDDLRPVGVIRGERISLRIIQKLGRQDSARAQAAT